MKEAGKVLLQAMQLHLLVKEAEILSVEDRIQDAVATATKAQKANVHLRNRLTKVQSRVTAAES